MKNSRSGLRSPVPAIFLTLSFIMIFMFSVSASAYEQTVAEISIEPQGAVWTPIVENNGFSLKVLGAEGAIFTAEFKSGEPPFFDLHDNDNNLFPDGLCNYELTANPVLSEEMKQILSTVRSQEENGEPTALVVNKEYQLSHKQSGVFSILNGELVTGGTYSQSSSVSENQKIRVVEDSLEKGETSSDTVVDRDTLGATASDVVHADDVVITGSECVGFDCANGESFGFDTLRLKENNLRIKFMDTSNSGSFPSVDWQITANDSSNGGANKFSIDDIDSGRTPFTIEHSAPNNSLYVDDGGRIGLGTSTPVVELHVVDGDTPTLRLEQDGSSGFTAQTWDVAGNETNFFIRDATNGSLLPFKIRPSAPNNSLYINTNGDIGLGTASPAANFHIENGVSSTNASIDQDFVVTGTGNVGINTTSPAARFHVANDSSTTSDDVVITSDGKMGIGTTSPGSALQVSGSVDNAPDSPGFHMGLSGTYGTMELANTNGGFIDFSPGDGTDFLGRIMYSNASNYMSFYTNTSEAVRINSSGKVGIGTQTPSFTLHVEGTAGKPGGGSWSSSSDERLKTNIKDLDGKEALEKLMQLRGVTYEWINPEIHSYGTRMGLIAQELENVFPEWVDEITPRGKDSNLIPEGSKSKTISFPHDFNACLIEALKEQQRQIEELSAQLESLKERVESNK